MARIRERNGSHNVTWVMGGRGGKTQSCTFEHDWQALKAKQEAEKAGHNITGPEVEGIVHGWEKKPTKIQTIADYWPKYLKFVQQKGTRGVTWARYQRQFDMAIGPQLGHMPVTEVFAEHITDFMAWLRQCDCGQPGAWRCRTSTRRARGEERHGLTEDTLGHYLAPLRALFNHAIEAEVFMRTNPVRAAGWLSHKHLQRKGRKRKTKKNRTILTAEQYELFRAALPADVLPLVDYLMFTGARWGEASAATVDSIEVGSDGEEGLANILTAWTKDESNTAYLDMPKGGEERYVTIPSELIDSLQPVIMGRAPDELLFVSPTGKPWDHTNFCERRWYPALAKAMRCEKHPPPGAQPVQPGDLAGPLCGDNGGLNQGRKPCGRKVDPGTDRCVWHQGPDRLAVSTCKCPTRLQLKRIPSPHDLRHTHAHWLVAMKWSYAAIAERLGHASEQTTRNEYGGVMSVEQQGISRDLGQVFRKITGAS